MSVGHTRSDDIGKFLAELAAPESIGAPLMATAVAGAMGTSLLLHVAGLPTTRSGSVDERHALAVAAAMLKDVRSQLVDITETRVPVKPSELRPMAKGKRPQRLMRDGAIELTLRAAADVPLEVIRLCASALKYGQTVAACSCRAARSDVEFAIALLRIGMDGARSHLEAKLNSLTDLTYTKAVVQEVAHLNDEGSAAARAAELSVQPPPA